MVDSPTHDSQASLSQPILSDSPEQERHEQQVPDAASTDGEVLVLRPEENAFHDTGSPPQEEEHEEPHIVNENHSEAHRLSILSAQTLVTAASLSSNNTSNNPSRTGGTGTAVRPSRRTPSSGNLAYGNGASSRRSTREGPGSVRHHSPSLVRSASKAALGGKSMTRSSSKPELSSLAKGKASSSLAVKPVGATRGKQGLTSGAPPGLAISRAASSTAVPAANGKGAASKVGGKPTGLPGKSAWPPEGLKRPPAYIPTRIIDPKQLKEVVRRWYKFDRCGRMSIIEAAKAELTHSLGVHSRDLRIFDTYRSSSSYASCILCREHALVINLEFIQVIVTCDTALVVNAERAHEPHVQSFIEDLQRRLSSQNGLMNGMNHCLQGAAEDSRQDAGTGGLVPELTADGEHATMLSALQHAHTDAECDDKAADIAAGMPGSAREAFESEVPFELKVLETCLDNISASMSKEVRDLERDSTGALDALAQRVTPGNLDTVRRVKNRMVRLNTRVDTIRTLLEKYLADDADLAELHLSGQRILEEQRAEKQRLREERRAERLERYEMKRRRRLEDDPYASEPSSVSNSTFTLSDDDDGWLSSQAEMVLEPYFMSLDSTWNRLQAIGEYIDDTEDYVNITLDSHRNQLIQVDLLLTAATFCVGLVTLIAGLFGMNLFSGLDTTGRSSNGTIDVGDGVTGAGQLKESEKSFVLVSVLSCALAVALLVAFIFVMRYKQLAFV